MLFHQKGYREIIRHYLDKNLQLKGYRTRLAKAAGFHPSTLPQVLANNIHLTPEQGLGLCLFWEFDARSTDYFLTLINYERASSKQLKKHLKDKLDEISTLVAARNVKVKDLEMSAEDAAEGYTSWEHSAVIAALEIEGINTVALLADFLIIHPVRVEKILSYLERLGLTQKDKDRWSKTNAKGAINQNRDIYSQLLMANLQAKALTTTTKHHNSFFAGLVFPTNPKDFAEVKAELLKVCQGISDRDRKNKKSMVACLCMNLFELGGRDLG